MNRDCHLVEVHLAGGFHDIALAVKEVPGNYFAIPDLEADHEETDLHMFCKSFMQSKH